MNITILLVDDDPISNFVSHKFLQRMFPCSDISTFHSGASALDYLRVKGFQADVRYLIFLDINMPVISGWDFLEMLEETMPELAACVVMLTSSVDYNDREKASSFRSVSGFLSKPLDQSDLDILKPLILEEAQGGAHGSGCVIFPNCKNSL